MVAGGQNNESRRVVCTKPNWIELEHRPSIEKLTKCVEYVQAIIDAIAAENREPDDWEAKHLAYAIHAIVEKRYYGALTFAEMALIEPDAHRPSRVRDDSLEPVKLSHLQKALDLLKAKLMPKR